MAKKTVTKREQLRHEVTKNKILELFVCQYPVDEIAAKCNTTPEHIETVLSDSLREFFNLNQQYAERAALMNTAKLRLLTKTWLPKALEGNYNAANLVLKMIKLEDDMSRNLNPEKSDAAQTVEFVNRFEQTMTSTDPRYAIALANLNEEVDDSSIFSLPSIEKLSDIPALTDDSTSDIANLMQKHEDLLRKIDINDTEFYNTDPDL